MNKRVLSVLCCVALLLSCVSGLGAVAETTSAQQACVSGATLTAINSSADAALLPTGTNLLAGKSLLSGSSGKSNGDLNNLFDGLYQGINQNIVYTKNPDGTWYRPDERYATVGSNVGDTRYNSGVTKATATTLGYAQLGFDLGTATQISKIAVGSSAEGANSSINHAQFSDPNFDGVETVFTKDTRLHMMDIYVSNSASTLYDDANKIITADYLNGDITARASSQAPIANVFAPTEETVGQYVGFRFYLAGSGSSVSTTYNDKTANWGWWDQVRISELGVFGEAASAPAVSATVYDITDGVNEDKIIAAEDNILGTAASASTGESIPARMYDGQLAGVTDGCTWDDKTTGWLAKGDSTTRKLYLTWDLGRDYAVDSFLVAGSGVSGSTYGPQATAIYVGDKTGAQIKANSAAAEPVYAALDVIVFGRRIVLNEAVVGRYIVFELDGFDRVDVFGNAFLTELAATGTETESVEPAESAYTLYKADTMAANMTPVADNVLAQAVAADYRLGDGGATADSKLLGALVDGAYGGAAEQKLCPAGNEYVYFTYDLGKVYSLDTLTYVGDGSDGANSVAVYVGLEDWPATYAAETAPDAFYDGAIGKTSRQTNNKTDSIGIRFSFATPLLGRYVTFRLQGCVNGGNKQVWAAEFAATGKDATVAPYMAEELAARLPSADDNVLAKATDAYYRFSAQNYNSTNSGLRTTLTNGVVSAEDTLVLTPNCEYVYITYDMGAPYDFTSLLFAGVGTDGANSVAVWVGNEKLSTILSKDVAPNAFYDGGIGTSDRVTNNKTGAVAVGFNITATGRYVTFRLATCANGKYKQVWLSEFAAVGKAAPVSAEKTETIVCVGDSITYGTVFTTPDTSSWSAIQLANGYPAQLERLLNDAADGDVYYNVVNAGISASAIIGVDQTIPGTDSTFPNSGNGTPTTWLVEQESRGLNHVQAADKVLIMLGTNDAHNSNNTWSARAPYYKEYYKKVIDAFRAENPAVEIYVVTSPYTSVSTHKNNLENGVVPLQKQLAAELGLPLIDVYEASKYHVEVLNDGDLSSFIDSNDISKGLSLHPDEEGQGVIAKACFDALTGDANDLYTVKSDGGQLRGYEGGIPAGNMALRFSMTLPVKGVTCDANYYTQLTADSKITVAGKEYTVTDMGTVVAIADKLDNPQIELFADSENNYVKNVPARKLYDVTDEGVTFTAVVTNVSEDNYNSGLVARGYVRYQDGDVTRYAYGPVCERSVSDVVSAYTAAQYDLTYDMWNGYKQVKFTIDGMQCQVVMPDEAAEGRPWIWRTEFFGIASVATDQELLDAGWHLAYCKVSNMYGNPESVALMKSFYDVAVPMLNLKRKTVLEGFSRGGLYAANFAATYPECTAGLYLDAPVQDICSWPASLYSDNTGDAGCWADCKNDYGFSSDAEALADRTASPRWKYDILIENNIPVLLVYGGVDNVVPFAENGQHLVDAYTNAGRTDLLKVKCFEDRGHSHGWTGEASAHILEAMNG